MTEELETCELGTQEYWNNRYKSEIKNFRNHGDVGEIWFGEDIVDRIIRWMEKSDLVDKNDSVLDVGCGNGMFLIELFNSGYKSLFGMDYSTEAVTLAKEIAQKQNYSIDYRIVDILSFDSKGNKFKVVHDKGTYDAVSLSENAKDNRNKYIGNIHDSLDNEGVLIITSCNWTQDELQLQFRDKFNLLAVIPTPQFKFGGKIGNIVSSIVLKKNCQEHKEV